MSIRGLGEPLFFADQPARSASLLSLLSLLDAQLSQQAVLQQQVEAIQRAMPCSSLKLRFLPITALSAASPLSIRDMEEVLIVPWSLGQRSGARRILSALVGAVPETLDTWTHAWPLLTACIPLSRLGGWSNDAATLTRMLAWSPGWDTCVTTCTNGRQRISILRAPDAASQPVETGNGRVAPEDAALYATYLVRVLQSVALACGQYGEKEEKC